MSSRTLSWIVAVMLAVTGAARAADEPAKPKQDPDKPKPEADKAKAADDKPKADPDKLKPADKPKAKDDKPKADADKPKEDKPATDADTTKADANAGPGSFQVLSVTGLRPGKYHCPVCEFGLHPTVLVFTRAEPDKLGPALTDLLKKLDAIIAGHPEAQPGCCVIFMNDGGYREALETKTAGLAAATEMREALEAKVRDLAKANTLEHITLSLGTADGPEGYGLDQKNETTVLLRHLQENVGRPYDFEKDKLTEADVEKIVKDVEAKVAEVDKKLGVRKRKKK